MFLETDGFLTELTKMYERQKASGTVWVTLKRSSMKRMPKRGREGVPSPETILDPAGTEWVVLARATDGKKKISTAVPLAKAERFNKSMTLIQKAHMDGLEGDGEEEQEGGGRGRRKAVG